MTVKRIVTNIASDRLEGARGFYGAILGLEIVMDFGWIMTFAGEGRSAPQISIASEGGSGTAVPDLSIEVDNLDEIYQRVLAAGLAVEYGPVNEPWGDAASTSAIPSTVSSISSSTAKWLDGPEAVSAQWYQRREERCAVPGRGDVSRSRARPAAALRSPDRRGRSLIRGRVPPPCAHLQAGRQRRLRPG